MSGTDDEPGLSDRSPARTRRATYGRRRGRPLKPKGRARLDTLLPRLQVVLPRRGDRLVPSDVFDREPERLWLEIGFGAGEHLAWQASRHPESGFLGAEVFLDGIVSLLGQIEQDRLENIRIHQGDGRDLLDVLPARSLARVFVLFPDPWPKRRHHKRRLVQSGFLDSLAMVMADGAELRLATDHAAYLSWMLRHLTSHPAFEWLARGPKDWRERPADWPATRYEMKALAEGRRPSFLRFRRRPGDLSQLAPDASAGSEEIPLAERGA